LFGLLGAGAQLRHKRSGAGQHGVIGALARPGCRGDVGLWPAHNASHAAFPFIRPKSNAIALDRRQLLDDCLSPDH
jgi:hypothetical protein